jgi:flavin-dependent thymidylate synthase
MKQPFDLTTTVELLQYTGKGDPNEWAAADLLLFTKSTRLELKPSLMSEIRAWPPEKKLEQLQYMANTIPSSWEFIDYVFLVRGVSRAYTHQQVRTRAASYAQQSLRVVDAGDFDYVFTDRNREQPEAMSVITEVLTQIKIAYAYLRMLGQPVEDARGILPTNIATNIVCKFNLRTFADLVHSRSGGRTQGEYQHVIWRMVDVVLEVHPWVERFLFGDFGRDYFTEVEEFAAEQFKDDPFAKGKLLKIIDKMRKAQGGAA